MSRIGRMPVTLPSGVKAVIANQILKVEGPKGKLERHVRPEVDITIEGGVLTVSRRGDDKHSRSFHGLERSLAHNMIMGVSEGFSKELQLIGVGYRADMKGTNVVNMALGYSHQIDFPLPEGVKGSVIKEGRDIYLKLEGVDKQVIGQTAAKIRSLRPPEPYKGKGIRYRGEVVKTKAGKTGKK